MAQGCELSGLGNWWVQARVWCERLVGVESDGWEVLGLGHQYG